MRFYSSPMFFLLARIVVLVSMSSIPVQAQVEIVHDFSKPGTAPVAPLVQGGDGFLYGTTSAGGANDQGSVFKIMPDGNGFSAFKSFQCGVASDGCTPQAGLLSLAKRQILFQPKPAICNSCPSFTIVQTRSRTLLAAGWVGQVEGW